MATSPRGSLCTLSASCSSRSARRSFFGSPGLDSRAYAVLSSSSVDYYFFGFCTIYNTSDFTHTMERFLGRYSSYIYALLRIVAGLLLLMHGTQKIFGWPLSLGMPGNTLF